MDKTVAFCQIFMALTVAGGSIYMFVCFWRDRKRWKARDAALEKEMAELRDRRNRLLVQVEKAHGVELEDEEGSIH